MSKVSLRTWVTLTAALSVAAVANAAPLGTAFTYQGQLTEGGVPVTTLVNLEFTLWSHPTSTLPADQIGGVHAISLTPDANGLFTVALNDANQFGPNPLNGDKRWLQITVDGNTLSPRQELAATPYALQTRGIFVNDIGNVGIGTTGPDHTLDVAGNVRGRERVAFGNDAAIGQGGTWNPDNARVFDFSHEITDFSLNSVWESFRSRITVNPPGAAGNGLFVTGHDFEAIVPAQNNYESLHLLRGSFSSAFHLGSGSIREINASVSMAETAGSGGAEFQFGHRVWSLVGGEGSVDENFGVEIVAGRVAGSTGSITQNISLLVGEPGFAFPPGEPQLPLTNHYGIYLANQDFGENDSYAIYNAGGDSYLNGDLDVTGTLSKAAGSFKIDHPLDPANKYLYHSFVESPDMMNIYNGNVVLDAGGAAIIALPDWFEALNFEFRYQLTCVGGFAPVYVARKIEDNHFKIAGGTPGLEVSWQVTGVRHDAYAQAHRIPVEQSKPNYARGHYLHPEVHGQPKMRHVQEARRTHLGLSPPGSRPGRGVHVQPPTNSGDATAKR